jgi:tetratricopeptide (TPR) repeat protein
LSWCDKSPPPLGALPLIGREALLNEIQEHLDENLLIVSGTGEGGIGTTALARTIAHSAGSRFPDGCIAVNLGSSGPVGPEPLTPAQVQRRVLRTLYSEIRLSELPEDPLTLRQTYQLALSEHKVLLLFDDAMSPAQLRYLLPDQSSVAIVTTQADLTATYPKLFTVRVGGLQHEEAYKLIGQVAPGALSLSQAGVSAVTSRLGGVPLALQIVAPLLGKEHPLLQPPSLLDSLELAQKRIQALRGPGTSHCAVLIAIETAYELLNPELKPYFEGLGVFPAPFTNQAAATVWNTSSQRAEEVLAQLSALALVAPYPQAPYYEMHHLVRLYAEELLLSQPDRAQGVVARYVEHFMREVIQASAGRYPAEPVYEAPPLDVYTLWEHLPMAWKRAVGRAPGWPRPQTMARWVADFPLQSKSLLKHTLSAEEHGSWLTSALEAAEALEDHRIVALHFAEKGRLSMQSDDDQAALSYFERQAQAARKAQVPALEAEALTDTGLAHGALGNVEAAEESWEKALSLFEVSQAAKADRVRIWLTELRTRSTTG